MSMFSTAIDGNNRRWQFKTGDDDMAEFRIGDPVPYNFNPEMALDVRFEDDVYHAVEERGEGVSGWVVIKDHKIAAVLLASKMINRRNLLERFNIQLPSIHDWEAEAIIAYHSREIHRQNAWIETRDKIAKECGDPLWHRKPGAHMRLMLRQEGFARRILPVTPL